ncbi:MAG: hypothetical protein JWP87_5379 [Labilithrix sp.]|nr:hypothetical protein [Labilithrix sp.]
MRSSLGLLVSTTLAAATLLAASDAGAAMNCDSITRLKGGAPAGPVVYVSGGLQPLIAELAKVLFADPVAPITIVQKVQGSCIGLGALLEGTPPLSGTANYWDPDSTSTAPTSKQENCTLPGGEAGTPANVDIAISDVFPASCRPTLAALPAPFADFFGPIQMYNFVVPAASQQQSISAEAAYFVFGFGSGSGVAPWIDNNFIVRRNAGSGTQVLLGTAIAVPAARWAGIDGGSSDGVLGKLTSFTSAEDVNKAIGIVAGDYSVRPGLRQLAYQHYGQRCAYLPDVKPGDKRNVRDGHYPLWGPVHLLTRIDPATGLAVNPNVRRVIAYLTGVTPPPQGLDLISVEARQQFVSPCAMSVSRKTEMGPMSPYTPPRSCKCAFDNATAGTSCTPCTQNAQCPATAPSCNFGYCEPQ